MDTRDTDNPWAEINPPMASAPPPEPRSTCSAQALPEQFATELTKCLALAVPAGMEEAARREWLAAAWETCGHLSSDLLREGCAHARQVADHPSKIVPAIIARAHAIRDAGKQFGERRPQPDPVPQIEATPCPPKEAEDILREYGLLDAVRRA